MTAASPAQRADELSSAVSSTVTAVVAAVLDLEPTTVDERYALGECDSIDLVEIAERVEARLRPAYPALAIDDAALARCSDVGELVGLVVSSLAPRPA